MLLGITGFEIRYQLKNPVFWVAIAIFFLLGFGLTASENVSIGTPGAVHENSPYAIAVATAVLTLFYLFVVTAFVANAIVRDDTSGFAPIVRATRSPARQIVLGRFLGGLVIAWLGYLAVPLGMCARVARCRGSIPRRSARRSCPITPGTSRLRAAQHLPDQRLAVRAGDRAALDDGVLHRRGGAGDGLSHHHQHRRPADRISRDVRAVGSRSATARCARRPATGPRPR